jgi:hypothetical protein
VQPDVERRSKGRVGKLRDTGLTLRIVQTGIHRAHRALQRDLVCAERLSELQAAEKLGERHVEVGSGSVISHHAGKFRLVARDQADAVLDWLGERVNCRL